MQRKNYRDINSRVPKKRKKKVNGIPKKHNPLYNPSKKKYVQNELSEDETASGDETGRWPGVLIAWSNWAFLCVPAGCRAGTTNNYHSNNFSPEVPNGAARRHS